MKNKPIIQFAVGILIGALLMAGFHSFQAAQRQAVDQAYNEGFIAGSEDMHTLQTRLEASR